MFQPDRKSSPAPTLPVGGARALVGLSVAACLSVVWAHGLVAPLRHLASVPPKAWALPLTLSALAVAVVAATCSRRRPHYPAAVSGALAAWVVCALLLPGAAALGVVLLPIALASARLSHAIASRLPASVDTLPRTRCVQAGLWVLIALVAVVQLARLSTWISDPSSDWFLTTEHPFWAKHECLSAYVYGGELALRGEENIYASEHYPGLDPDAKPKTEVAHMVVEDPFQYAPQFLLWPAAALALTRDYPTIRSVWFALQTTLLFTVIAWLGVWVGGRAGRMALWLWPLALSAFPALHALQYGQFHLAVIASSIAAMLAFESGRDRIGGALLSVAVLSKLFPGVLLIVVAARRQWRALAWTAGFGGALTVASVIALGHAPFEAFFDYHLPRLQSGAAFAFGEAWPEMRAVIIAANQGVYGLVIKLGEMGTPGADAAAAVWVNRLYLLGLAVVSWLVGRRRGSLDREQRAVTWFSLLGLGSMASTGAFVDYLPLTATWLLTLLAHRIPGRPLGAILIVVWVFQYTLFGAVPVGSYFEPRVMMPLSALSAVMLLGLFGLPLYRSMRAPETTTASRVLTRARTSP